MKYFYFLLMMLSIYAFSFAEKDKTKLRVKVEGIKETKGIIGVMVFNGKKGFPTSKENAIYFKEVRVEKQEVVVEFDDLPPGKYAISLLHDLNENRRLDKNFMGIPKEPFGFSRNKNILSGLPDFEEAAILIGRGETESSIKLINFF